MAGLLVAAAGFALLAGASRGTGAAALLAPLLLWGCGLGVLTPAVVSAAMGAVERERAGLASAVNNTARQAGGAVGIAAFGARPHRGAPCTPARSSPRRSTSPPARVAGARPQGAQTEPSARMNRRCSRTWATSAAVAAPDRRGVAGGAMPRGRPIASPRPARRSGPDRRDRRARRSVLWRP